MALIPGTRLGPYEIVGPLGAGGMGKVYRAKDTRPAVAREVAIKLVSILAADPAAATRFERESRVTASLAHPNVVALFDVGVHEGTPYLVEELLTGETLRARMRSSPVAPRKAVEWLRQVTLGLAAAHARDLVHRDVKPENIFLTSDGHVKLLDFGLAKAAIGSVAGATTAVQAATATGDAVTSGRKALRPTRSRPATAPMARSTARGRSASIRSWRATRARAAATRRPTSRAWQRNPWRPRRRDGPRPADSLRCRTATFWSDPDHSSHLHGPRRRLGRPAADDSGSTLALAGPRHHWRWRWPSASARWQRRPGGRASLAWIALPDD